MDITLTVVPSVPPSLRTGSGMSKPYWRRSAPSVCRFLEACDYHASEDVLNARGPCEAKICHSDQGSQYTSRAFKTICDANQIRQSVASVGDCYDNTQIESLFASLKKECISKLSQPNRVTIRREVIRWIEACYNPRRLHSQLDYLSPVAFERQVASTTLERAGNVT